MVALKVKTSPRLSCRGSTLRQSERCPERSEGSAMMIQILRTWKTVLRMRESCGSSPPRPHFDWRTCGERSRAITNCQLGGDGAGCLSGGLLEADVGRWRGGPNETQAVGNGVPIREGKMDCTDPPWLAVKHREVDIGRDRCRAPGAQAVGSTLSGRDCSQQIADRNYLRGDPPWLVVKHREVDVGQEGRLFEFTKRSVCSGIRLRDKASSIHSCLRMRRMSFRRKSVPACVRCSRFGTPEFCNSFSCSRHQPARGECVIVNIVRRFHD